MADDCPQEGAHIVFTGQERRRLLDESIAVPPEILSLIESAPSEADAVRVWLSLDDLEDLVGGLAADASAQHRRQVAALLGPKHDHLAGARSQAALTGRPASLE